MQAEAVAQDTGSVPPLGVWLKVFAPAYRGALARLFLLNLLSAVITFVELQLLRALTVVLSGPAPPAGTRCTVGTWAHAGFPVEPAPCGASLPALLLGTYAAAVAIQAVVDMLSNAGNTRLTTRARADAERELLRNLLLQDDAFYLRRAPSEIISRLSGDLQRVGNRRQIAIQAISTVLSIIAVSWVLVTQSWAVAALGAIISAAGILVAAPLLFRQRGLETQLIASDEHVKAGFEDTLQGVAEIQVSGLLAGVLRRFQGRQAVRNAFSLRHGNLSSGINVAQRLTFSVGFIAALALVVFTSLFQGSAADAGGENAANAGLIVLLISSLPTLYFKFGDLTQLYAQFQLADIASARLRQYEAPPAPPPAPTAPTPEGGIVLDRVRYTFTGGHAMQGGPDGMSLVVPPRGLIGIVGPAGAGKSTLIRLILGRQLPAEGRIATPAQDGPDPLFMYVTQRPILFDSSLGDNLFLASPGADAATLVASGDRLAALGVMDLVRQKGLDAMPAEDAPPPPDLAAIRAGFLAAGEGALGTTLYPFGPGHAAPRQMLLEAMLGCAADQEAIGQRLTSAHSREAVRALVATPLGAELARLAGVLIRQTAPLLTQGATPDDYNRIAPVKLDMAVFQLRSGALEAAMAEDRTGPPPAVLVAVGLTARVEEIGAETVPLPDAASRAPLQSIVAGIARPLEIGALNPLLTWRENLLFAAAEPGNSRRVEQLDRVVLDHLRTSAIDHAVVTAGLDYAVGRQGGRLSGGQQQLVALGRALLSPARFLVLDEPSSALHPGLRASLLDVLREEAADRAVLVVTHDMELARGCGRILFVRDGMLAGDGDWATLAASNPAFRAWSNQGGEPG